MKDIHLYCVSHKPIDLPHTPGLSLLQVGNSPTHFSHLRDDNGVNISEKNSFYSELTAFYYIWKNRPSDYVGFCHYRRYLLPRRSADWLNQLKPARYATGYKISEPILMEHISSQDNPYVEGFEHLLTKADILLPKSMPLPNGSFLNQYINTHDAAPMFRVLALLAEQDDHLGKTAYHFFTHASQSHWNNMFIARWEIFDRYCQFLFPLFEKLEQEVILPDSPYQKRVYAFLSERLFNFWLAYNRIKVATVDWCIVEESLKISEAHHVNQQS